MSGKWHILTGEYPYALGGVADYTYQVAGALAATGTIVHVWCPTAECAVPSQLGVEVHSSFGALMPRDLLRVGAKLDALPGPRRLLIQWVPHAFGLRSLNLPFCLWVLKRAVFSGDSVDLMIHEAFLDVRGTIRQRLAAVIQRAMMVVLLLAAKRVWVSVPRWWQLVQPFAFRRRIAVVWLPVPSNVPSDPSLPRVDELRSEVAALTIGHFGSFSSVTNAQLIPILEAIVDRCPEAWLRLIGRGASSAKAHLVSRRPDLLERIVVADGVGLDEVSSQIAASDVMIQPYLDGVSSRRTSFMACLALGIATVTHAGESTEPDWHELDACVLVEPLPEAYATATDALLADEGSRRQLGSRARHVYDERFHIRHVVDRLRRSDDTVGPSNSGSPEGGLVGAGRH